MHIINIIGDSIGSRLAKRIYQRADLDFKIIDKKSSETVFDSVSSSLMFLFRRHISNARPATHPGEFGTG